MKLLAIIALVVIGKLAASPTASGALIEIYFSPKGGCTGAIVAEIGKAKQTVRIQTYSFGSAPIADALIAAKARGVDVRVLFDKSWRDEMARLKAPVTQEDRLVAAGILCAVDGKHQIAHNKVRVIDGAVVITGSFNDTGQAETSNAENIAIIRRKKEAAEYGANWDAHAAHSIPLPSQASGKRQIPSTKSQNNSATVIDRRHGPVSPEEVRRWRVWRTKSERLAKIVGGLTFAAEGGGDGITRDFAIAYGKFTRAQEREYAVWTRKVRVIAKRKGFDITGDDGYFRTYFKDHCSPRRAIWHWKNDAWPNNGGGP